MCLFLTRHYFYFWWNITWPFLAEMLSDMFQAAFSNFQTHSKLNWQRGFRKINKQHSRLEWWRCINAVFPARDLHLIPHQSSLLHPASSLNSLSGHKPTRLIQQHKETLFTTSAELTRSSETSGDIRQAAPAKCAAILRGKFKTDQIES